MKHLAGSLSRNSHLSNGVPTDPCDWCVLLSILRDLGLIERTAKTGDFVVDILKKISISRHIRSPACMSSKKIFPPWKFRNICHLEDRDPEPIYVCVSSANTHLSAHFSFSCYSSAQLQSCAFCAATHTAMCYNSMFIAAALRIIAQTALGCLGIDPH